MPTTETNCSLTHLQSHESSNYFKYKAIGPSKRNRHSNYNTRVLLYCDITGWYFLERVVSLGVFTEEVIIKTALLSEF